MSKQERVRPNGGRALVYICCPSRRYAEDWCRVDLGVHPGHPNIRFVGERLDALRGLKPEVVVVIVDRFIDGTREWRSELNWIIAHRGHPTKIPDDVLEAMRAGQVIA